MNKEKGIARSKGKEEGKLEREKRWERLMRTFHL
jgi:hypothetical protein